MDGEHKRALESKSPNEIVDKLVGSTIDIWNKVKAKMLPTPAKFHYLFNLRDLSRVFQGVFYADAESTINAGGPEMLAKLWKHECMRVFSDKLIDHTDKSWFADAIDKQIEADFGSVASACVGVTNYFVDYLRPPGEDPETGEALAANASKKRLMCIPAAERSHRHVH